MDSQLIAWMISLGAWNWFILAALLFLLEIIAPGSFMMWLGLSAIAGRRDLALHRLVVAGAGRSRSRCSRSLRSRPGGISRARSRQPTEQPFLNRRAEGFVGREFTLDKPIIDGIGTIRIDDTVWRVRGPDCPAGSRVKVAAHRRRRN